MHESSSRAAAPRTELPSSAPAPRHPDPSVARSSLEAIACPAALLDETGVVREVNAAWDAAPVRAASPGQGYLAGLRFVAPAESEALDALSLALSGPPDPGLDVSERTLECHGPDSEHWFSVSVSTVGLGARRAWLVLHQDATALRQMERRCRLTRRLAAVQASPDDPTVRVRALAVAAGEVLDASAVVLWERTPSGVLRARPLEMGRLAPQVTTIAQRRLLVAAMGAPGARWLRLPDRTPCLAVPTRAREQVALFHFPPRPRFDAETLRLVARALQPEPAPGEPSSKAGRHRTPREIRRMLGQEAGAATPYLAQQERQHIERTLAQYNHNVLRTAQALGIARSTLYERLKDYGIAVPARRERLSPSPA